jgi:NAD+ synthase (glutamine-hydrolysing)
MHGFYRITVASPRLHLGSTNNNKIEILNLITKSQQSSIILFPELCITGYSAGDMFFNKTLYDAQISALNEILQESKNISSIVVLGVAIMESDRLYNCGIAIQNGNILGIVPKSYLPNKREFYEKRHFTSGFDARFNSINICGQDVPFGLDLIFSDNNEMTFGIEICEDLWALTPPSNQLASNGATLILNLSASNELVGKANYRADLVKNQSARLLCAYAYSSSGVYESTSDTVFSGDSIICEYGSMLARSKMFERKSQLVNSDVDLQKLTYMRLSETSFCDSPQTNIRKIICKCTPVIENLNRDIDPTPFVPSSSIEKELRCDEIVNIQANSLITRLESANIKKVVIGVSGGLDSTLALLVCNYAFEMMGWNKENIIAITMAGFGTTNNTKSNAHKLCGLLSIAMRDIPIIDIAKKEFEAIGHNESDHSVVYENVQARIRTTILMNIANKEGGIVIGTGDLSEIALGWNTYNGDHMSSYGLNSGVPKTLVKFLVEYFQKNSNVKAILQDIIDTPISPELLPHDTGVILQETEKIIGPYELHDFFIYHMLKYGAKPSKILFLAELAFENKYNEAEIKEWLIVFIKRFFTQQFKRNAMPDGPKVGTISLSPRADLRMPSEMNFNIWIDDLTK